MQKPVKMTLNGKKLPGNGQVDRIFMNLKVGIRTLPWGYIHVNVYALYSQIYWYTSQISGGRLQNQSSGFKIHVASDSLN